MGELIQQSRSNEIPIVTNADFWNWFMENEGRFYEVVKTKGDIEHDFFDTLSAHLQQLGEGYWFLSGMFDDTTAELVLTADGIFKNIVFVEELVQSAPKINNWRITALKPALDINDVSVNIGDLSFDKDNLSFYSMDDPLHPDEIDITVVYDDYIEELKDVITNGVYVFLDNYLGELYSVTTIDSVEIMGEDKAEKELIPIEKLKGFLMWREKEFVGKYEEVRYNTENDKYSSLEVTLESGKPFLVFINSNLMEWEGKVSHPWIITIDINYEGKENGMPDEATFNLMNTFEDRLKQKLKDAYGYLNIGSETGDGLREIFYACKDFRLPSKILKNFQNEYRGQLNFEFDIYKDKYWKSFDRYKTGY